MTQQTQVPVTTMVMKPAFMIAALPSGMIVSVTAQPSAPRPLVRN